MSIRVKQAPELSIREYVASLGLNPENVFYQTVTARNISLANASWTITSPNKRSFLLSHSPVDWKPTIGKFREDGVTAEAWGASQNYISFKPFPFANSMTSITLSCNGATITNSQPRRYWEQLCMANVTRNEMESNYESGYPEDLGGNIATGNPGKPAIAQSIDHQWLKNEASFTSKLFKATTPNVTRYNDLANTVQISYQEPTIIAPFNPFAKVKSGMPDYMWFKHMSDVIPNVDRLELEIQFDKLSAGALFPRFTQASVNANEFKHIQITALAADWLLYWYETPINQVIPRQVDLNTYQIKEFQRPVVAPVQGTRQTVISDLIQLNSTPTLIMISCRRDQSVANYVSRSMSSQDDYKVPPTAVIVNHGTNHSWDSYAEIHSLDILLGDRPNVISSGGFTQRELYELTLKNSKSPYPYNFQDWSSKQRITSDSLGNLLPAEVWASYGSKCVCLLQPKDMAEKVGPGIFSPNSFQVQAQITPRDGFAGITSNGNISYTFYVHLFYGSHFLRLEPDRAQYQEMSVPLDEARRLLNPVLQSQGVNNLGGGLGSVRARAGRSFGSGVRSRIG